MPSRPSRRRLASLSPARRRLSARLEPSRPAQRNGSLLPLPTSSGRAEPPSRPAQLNGSLPGRAEPPSRGSSRRALSPVERIVLVAAAAFAQSETKKAREIGRLRELINIRDEVLLSMQQKLENMCTQMTCLQEQPVECRENCYTQNHQPGSEKKFDKETIQDIGQIDYVEEKVLKTANSIVREPEERRMSDLSYFNWSVTSSVDYQPSKLEAEQEFCQLQKECDEKDAMVKELCSSVHSSSIANSKRIMELEETIRRKNIVTSELKKDMMVLEKQVIKLTRLHSASSTTSTVTRNMPLMVDNILYDMTGASSSSSDSESSVSKEMTLHVDMTSMKGKRELFMESVTSVNGSSERPLKQKFRNENGCAQTVETTATPRQRRLTNSSEGLKQNRRRSHSHQELKSTNLSRR